MEMKIKQHFFKMMVGVLLLAFVVAYLTITQKHKPTETPVAVTSIPEKPQQAVDLARSESVLNDQQQNNVYIASASADRTQTTALTLAKQHTPSPVQANTKTNAPVNSFNDIAQEAPTPAQVYVQTLQHAIAEGYGTTPPIEEDNAQVRSVLAALSNQSDPQRVSALVAATPFDRDQYQHSTEYRQQYLSVAEPGRAFQVAEAGQQAPPLQRLSAYYQEVQQGETITLVVGGEPNAPISFTSFDLGKFENGLTFITKQADGSGFVSVDFYGMPGTIADSHILSASPLSANTVKFIVFTSAAASSSIN